MSWKIMTKELDINWKANKEGRKGGKGRGGSEVSGRVKGEGRDWRGRARVKKDKNARRGNLSSTANDMLKID